MCNCNQQRASYLSESEDSHEGMVKVKLMMNKPMVLNGNITGRMYVFRKKNDINWVDNRDILSMKDVNELQIFF